MRTLRRAVLALLVSSPAGCGAGRPAEEAALAPRAPARERLPAFVVTTPRTRLVGGADRKTVAIPKARVPLRIVEDGAAPPGLVAVAIDGGIALTALASRDELGVLVCEGGPVGAHLYAGDRNLIVLGGARPGGRFAVRGDVVLPGFARVGETAFARTFVDAAVDDDVLVSGWIDTAALGAKLPE